MAWARITTVTLNPAIDRVLIAEGFRVGAHIRAKRVGGHPAGKGINVSRVLAMLGTRSVATGFVGRDDLSGFEEFLERVGEGRVVMQLLVVRGRTRENMTVMDPVGDSETHIREEGFEVSPADARRVISKIGMLARRDGVMAFSGSLPPGIRLGDFRSMLHRCADQGARVVVDTSAWALEALRDERIWLLKLNVEELETLTGASGLDTEDAVVEAARAASWEGGGPAEYVIATRGAHGAILVGPGVGVIGRVFVHPGRIAHTVGCGDSLLAGILHGRQEGRSWESALRLGVATATANATSRTPGRLSLDDVDEFVEAAMMSSLSTT
jgi:1-phosphofructokinase family hexose kinase